MISGVKSGGSSHSVLVIIFCSHLPSSSFSDVASVAVVVPEVVNVVRFVLELIVLIGAEVLDATDLEG